MVDAGAHAANSPPKHIGYLAVLRNRNFAVIWAGQAISMAGDAVHRVALLWLVKEMTGSGTAMGTVALCASLPLLFFGLFAGVVADLVDRKKLMIWSDLLRAGLVLLVPVLSWWGDLQVWHLCAVAFLHSCISIFFNPALMATIPNVVGKEGLISANSLSQLTMRLAGIFGPALGGILIAAAGTMPAFLLNSASFLASAAAIGLAAIPGMEVGEKSRRDLNIANILGGVKDGVGFVLAHSLLLSMVIIAVILNFFGAPMGILAALHVDIQWQAGAVGFGTVMSALSAGAFAGIVCVGPLVRSLRRERVVSLSILLQGACLVLFALGRSLFHGITAFALFGFCNSVANVPMISWLQEAIPDRMRGRVFSAVSVACEAASPLSLATAGWAADAVGTVPLFMVIGSSSMVGGLWLARVFQVQGGMKTLQEEATA